LDKLEVGINLLVQYSFSHFKNEFFHFQRKTEFRKLCDKLRNHLELVLKQTPSPVTINLSNADTQQMNLDTRWMIFKYLRSRSVFFYLI